MDVGKISVNDMTMLKQLFLKDLPVHMMGHLLPGSIVWVVLICLALVSASHFVNKGCRVNY